MTTCVSPQLAKAAADAVIALPRDARFWTRRLVKVFAEPITRPQSPHASLSHATLKTRSGPRLNTIYACINAMSMTLYRTSTEAFRTTHQCFRTGNVLAGGVVGHTNVIDTRQIVRACPTKWILSCSRSWVKEGLPKCRIPIDEFDGRLVRSCITVGVEPLCLRLQNRYSADSAV